MEEDTGISALTTGGECDDGAQDAIKSHGALDATDDQTNRQTSRRRRTAEWRRLWARRPRHSLAAVAATAGATPSSCRRACRRSRIGGRRVRCAHRAEPDQVGAKPAGVMRNGKAHSGLFRSLLDACITTIVFEQTIKTPPRLSRAGLERAMSYALPVRSVSIASLSRPSSDRSSTSSVSRAMSVGVPSSGTDESPTWTRSVVAFLSASGMSLPCLRSVMVSSEGGSREQSTVEAFRVIHAQHETKNPAPADRAGLEKVHAGLTARAASVSRCKQSVHPRCASNRTRCRQLGTGLPLQSSPVRHQSPMKGRVRSIAGSISAKGGKRRFNRQMWDSRIALAPGLRLELPKLAARYHT